MINLSLEWKTYKIGDVVSVRRGASPRPIKDYISEAGVPWVKIADATSDQTRFISSTKEFIIEDGVKSSVTVYPGDLIVSNSATPGLPKFMKIKACVHDGWLVFDEYDGILKEYLYYYFIVVRDRLVNQANGSVFKNLKTDIVRDFDINLPSLETQEKIIKILSSIDEKIEKNIAINKNLHLQRKELFKHWFIDFSSSNYELTDTTFGLIPKSWNIYGFKEILTKRTEKSNDSSIPMFSVTNTGIHPREEKFNKKLSTTSSKFKLIYKNDLVFGMSREILNWGLMDEEIGGVSSAYNIFKINQDIVNPLYLKGFIENYMFYFKDIIKPASREGQGIDQNVLFIKQIYVPPENIFKEFFQIDIHFNKLIELNNNETGKLISLRDTLLPKLMSGEIDVSEINLAHDYLR